MNSNIPYHPEKAPLYNVAPQSPSYYVWKPGFFRRAPYPALFALLIAIACAVASAAILVISDEKPATWPVQPSVLLGFLASFSAAMLVMALSQGVTITWWRAALDPRGTTLARLHYIWNYGGGGGASAAWFSGKHVNKVAVASVMTAIAGITYSPLLQRASHASTKLLSDEVHLKLDVLPALPTNYTGKVTGPGTSASVTFQFGEVVQKWWSDIPSLTHYGEPYFCSGNCSGNVQSEGLEWNCTETETTVNLEEEAKTKYGLVGFQVRFSRYDDDNSVPNLYMRIIHLNSTDANCMGNVITKRCSIRSGTISHPVLIRGREVTTDFNGTSSSFKPHTSTGDLSTASINSESGPLAALQWVGAEYFSASDNITYDNETGIYSDTPDGIIALQWFDYEYRYRQGRKAACDAFRWYDPSIGILDEMRDILFRASLDAAPYNDFQEFTAKRTAIDIVYSSAYKYLGIASAILLFAILAVSWTLYGWWQLGRSMSLSPLEVAKAFGAPIFDRSSLPAEARGLVKKVGDQKLKYGEIGHVEQDGVHPVLLFGQVGSPQEPVSPRLPEYVNA